MPYYHTADLIMVALGSIAALGAFVFYSRGGGRKAATETIVLLKEQIAALEGKVDSLTEAQESASKEILKLRQENATLRDMVTSGSAIKVLAETLSHDRDSQREEMLNLHKSVIHVQESLNALIAMQRANGDRRGE